MKISGPIFRMICCGIFLILFTTSTRIAHGEELENYRKEIESLQSTLTEYPQDINILWNLARNYYHAGNAEGSKKQRLKDYKICQKYARQAISLNETSAEPHFWLGICYGKEAGLRGIFRGLALSDKIKSEMQRVVELDPTYSHAGGHRTLGRLFFKMPSLFGGDVKKSRSHLEEAVRIAPDNSTNHLFLAEVYMRKEKYDLAYKELKALLNLPHEVDGNKTIMGDREKAKKLMGNIPDKAQKD